MLHHSLSEFQTALLEKGIQLPNSDISNEDKVGIDVFTTDGLEYVQHITIGTPGQEFAVWVNLNVQWLLIPSAKCLTPSCSGRKKFDPIKSYTYHDLSRTWGITIAGLRASGKFGSDVMKIGSNDDSHPYIWDFTFNLAEQLTLNDSAESEFDGILGLLFDYDNDSFIDNLVEKGELDRPIFTIRLDSRHSEDGKPAGAITYGTTDDEGCESAVDYLPLISPQIFEVLPYSFEIDGIAMGNFNSSDTYTVALNMGMWIQVYHDLANAMAEVAGAKALFSSKNLIVKKISRL
ncbi:eukaryotic aspartyl protease [Oesophagostomum dentatum]|uniref:Eukaryotic aspartyl protease n=1 Tax=Oesophagostomum dentatum TaxID=61180 RepID=A0A0B1SWH1_OESDE|nr:eukaryotic aspartyl protease [Oesophagostomum dentatum]